MNTIIKNREFLKSMFSDNYDIESDQDKKLPQPEFEQAYNKDLEKIALPEVSKSFLKKDVLKKEDLFDILNDRKSNRVYTKDSVSLEELSFLLWATQGVKTIRGNNYATIRTVPSAGARHPFETYLAINRVDGLKKGIYRYLSLTHELLFMKEDNELDSVLTKLSMDQKFVGTGAVTFLWSVVPYRSEWRYNIIAHKHILLDAGHVCQNLYLACEAVGLGTCAIGAYDQKAVDTYLGLDIEEEFIIYMAPVGRCS